MTQFADFSFFMNALTARARQRLTLAVLASLLVHAGMIGLVSGRFTAIDTPAAPRTLEVLITPAKPLAVAPEPPKPRREPEVEPERMKRTPLKREQPSEKSPPAPAPKPVLALPSDTPPAPAFTAPPANIETRATASEQKPAIDPRSVATPPAPPSRETVATTPPNFSAAYLRNAPPRYPLSARRNGVEGRVHLKVMVTREGRPAQVLIQESSGSSALDNAALEAVKNWQFVPARRGQEPLESWVVVPIIFKLEGAS